MKKHGDLVKPLTGRVHTSVCLLLTDLTQQPLPARCTVARVRTHTLAAVQTLVQAAGWKATQIIDLIKMHHVGSEDYKTTYVYHISSLASQTDNHKHLDQHICLRSYTWAHTHLERERQGKRHLKIEIERCLRDES